MRSEAKQLRNRELTESSGGEGAGLASSFTTEMTDVHTSESKAGSDASSFPLPSGRLPSNNKNGPCTSMCLVVVAVFIFVGDFLKCNIFLEICSGRVSQ